MLVSEIKVLQMLDPHTQGRFLCSDLNHVIAVSLRHHCRAITDATDGVQLTWDKWQLPDCVRV